MDYNTNQINDIDKKLEREWSAHNKKKKILIFLAVIVFLFFTHGSILFPLKFGIAIPKGYETLNWDIYQEPIQLDYPELKKEQRKFEYKSLINGHIISVYPQAKYKISGLVVAYNYTFLIRNDFFDSAALYDLGLAWGKLGEKKFYDKYFECYSQKNEISGGRILWTKPKTSEMPVSIDYAKSHFSHSHIIPANRNVMAALLKIKRWDKIELEGELVDMKYTDKKGNTSNYQTSLSRTDENGNGDREYGACETIYVTKVKIGNTVYK